MFKQSILTLGATALFAGCATTATPTAPPPEGALSGYELVQLMSEAKLHGPSSSTPGATFEQNYPAIKPRQTKGKTTGIWRPQGETESTYNVKWSVNGDRWCENWGTGKDCWAIVPLGGNRYDFQKANGEMVTAEWRIDSPMTGPLRLSNEQLTDRVDTKYVGKWQYKSDSGTFESHYCADGRYFLKSSNDADWRPQMEWFVENNMTCRVEDGRKKCAEVYKLADGSQYSYRKTSEAAVTGQTTSIEPSDRCG